MSRVALLAMSALTLVLSAAAPALAQSGMEAMETAGARMQEQQAQAQADAVRPGDEQLTCDQLQAEMGATMNSPEMQTNMSEIEASAARQQEMQREAQERARGQMATGVVAGVIGSVIPGAGYAQTAIMNAQAREQQAAAAQGQTETAGMIDNMSNMMPAMMRGQRVVELARAQSCEFVQDMPAN